MKNRKSRLPVIIDILTHNNISSQDELSKHLAIKGYIVTQATLSRDLKKLKTTKVANDLGGYRYIVTESENKINGEPPKPMSTVQSALHPAAMSLAISGNMAVIKTRNGYASGLAYDLDMLHSPLILGTIPGADTVFAVISETATSDELFQLFSTFLPPQVINEAEGHFFHS